MTKHQTVIPRSEATSLPVGRLWQENCLPAFGGKIENYFGNLIF
jgi:hypothetical protein